MNHAKQASPLLITKESDIRWVEKCLIRQKMSLRRSSSAKKHSYAYAEKNLHVDSDLRQSRSYTYEILLPEDTGGAREYGEVRSLERSFSESNWKFEQKSTRSSSSSRFASRRSSRQTFGSTSSFGSQQRFIIDQFRVRFFLVWIRFEN